MQQLHEGKNLHPVEAILSWLYADTPHLQESLGEYRLEDTTPAMASRLVSYFYTGTYAAESDEPLLVHAHMFSLGDRYLLENLKTEAVVKYAADASPDDMGAFFRSLPDVFNLTPDSERGLRDEAIVFARDHLSKALSDEHVAQAFEASYIEAPTFTKDLLMSYLGQSEQAEAPILGRCRCSDGNIVPVRIVKRRCIRCSSYATSV